MLFKRFWYSVLVVILIIGITIIILYQLGNIETIDDSFVLRVTASVIAVSGAITRGGWDIQTVTGDTVIERIDNIMFKISQLSAVVILIIAFTL